MKTASTPSYKLAFVVSTYFPWGGMQRDLRRIAERCCERGHQVHVLTGSWQGERPQGPTVYELNTRALTNHGRNDRLARGVRWAAADGHFDCVVGFTKIPGLDIYYAADPCFAARLERERGRLHRLLPRYRGLRRQESAVFDRGGSSEILLIAHSERDKFIHYYGTEASRFRLLPPGIDREALLDQRPTRTESEVLRIRLGLASGDLLALAVGSGFRSKGVDRMLHALHALPPQLLARLRLAVIGRGRSRPLERLARRLGVLDRTIFLGPRDDVARFYFSADLLLHPARNENTGTVLLEAIACGLPVLTTANCGYACHVQAAGAGLVCPEPFDQGTLDGMLREALTSPERTAWRRNGPLYCEQTDLEGLVERATAVILDRARRKREGHATR